MSTSNSFSEGFNEALDALEKRVHALACSLDSHSRATDAVLDMKNEITDLRAMHLTTVLSEDIIVS